MSSILFILFLVSVANAQLTVDDWFFPVSVPPPQDNTIYDDDIKINPELEVFNKTNQEIKDSYDKDNLEKWQNQKAMNKYVIKNQNNLKILNKPHNKMGDDKLSVQKSTRFLPNSGIPVFIPQPPKLNLDMNEDPIITMSMKPIKTMMQPEEIAKSVEISRNRVDSDNLDIPSSTSSTTTETTSPTTMISSTTSQITTRPPFVYEISKYGRNSHDSSYENSKLRRDVNRLRNEMNLVKSLLNKLYKKLYRKQKDYIATPDPFELKRMGSNSEHRKHQEVTRLSALQNKKEDDKWIVIKGALRRLSDVYD